MGRPAHRRRGDRLGRQADAEHYATAFSEAYKQAVTPADAIDHIAIINELSDDSVKLVFSDRAMRTGCPAHLVSWVGTPPR